MVFAYLYLLTTVFMQLCHADEKANLENLEQSELQIQCQVKNANGSEDELATSLLVSNDEREKLQSELIQMNSTLQQFLCAFDTTHADILDICNDIYRQKCDVRCCDIQVALQMRMKHLVQASTMFSQLLANLSECRNFTNIQRMRNEKMLIDRILENPSASVLNFVEAGDADHLRCLLNSVPTNVNIRYDHDWTPLTVASIMNRTEIVKILLNAGANVDDQNLFNISSIPTSHTVIHAGRTLKMMNGAYATALIVAAYMNNTEICKILLDAGASPDIQNELGRTALMYAVQNGNLHLVKMLLDKGGNVEATTKEEGDTALHLAVDSYQGELEVVKLLVSHNANINVKNKKGETPLTVAWETRNRKAFIYLLNLGAED